MSSWGRDGEEVATSPCSPAGAPHRAPSLAGRRELAQEAWQQDGRWEALAHPALPGQSTGHKITMAASGLLSGMGPATDESLSHPCRYFHCGCPSTQPRQETRASAVSIQDSRPSAGFVSWLCSHGVSHPWLIWWQDGAACRPHIFPVLGDGEQVSFAYPGLVPILPITGACLVLGSTLWVTLTSLRVQGLSMGAVGLFGGPFSLTGPPHYGAVCHRKFFLHQANLSSHGASALSS